MHKDSNFSTSSPTLVIFWFWQEDNSHSNGCAVNTPCGFGCISLMISDNEPIFICSLTICISSTEEVYSNPLCAFKLGCCGVAGVLYCFGCESLSEKRCTDTPPGSAGCLFTADGDAPKVYILMQVVYLFLSVFLVSYPRNHCQIQQCEASPLFLDFTSRSWGCCWGPPTQYTLLSSQVTRCLEQLQYLILSQLTCDYCHTLIIRPCKIPLFLFYIVLVDLYILFFNLSASLTFHLKCFLLSRKHSSIFFTTMGLLSNKLS